MDLRINATRLEANGCVEFLGLEGTYYFADDQRLPVAFASLSDEAARRQLLVEAGISYIHCCDGSVEVFADHRGWNHLYIFGQRGECGPLIIADSPFAFASHCPIDWQTLKLVPVLGYIPPPLSPVEGVTQVRPGERITFDRITLEPTGREWLLPGMFSPQSEASRTGSEDRIAGALLEATAARTPTGGAPIVFLSGGFDSSLLVHLLQSLGKQPSAWTASFSSHLGERENIRAAAAARHYGVPWTQVPVDEEDVREHLQGVIDAMQEPFADVATLAEAVLARQAVKTHQNPSVFEGEGMDSLMCGSYKFVAERYRGLLLPLVALLPTGFLGGENRASRIGSLSLKLRQLKDLLQGGTAVERHVRFLLREFEGMRLQPEIKSIIRSAFESYYELLPDADALTRVSCMTLFGIIPNLENRKLRLIERYAGVNFELVYQDIDFVRLALTIPANRKVSRGYGKRAVRRVFADDMPRAVKGRAKLSFAFPVLDYFSEQEIRELSETRIGEGDAVRRAVEDHRSGRADHLAFLWGVRVANGWAKRYEEAASSVRADSVAELASDRPSDESI